MNFDLLKIDPAAASQRAAEMAASLKANKGVSDFRGYALGVVSRRLQRNPLDYRRYGPWWWAIKAQMRAAGHDVGAETDSMIEANYRGETPEQTLAAAEAFRDQQIATVGGMSVHFQLSSDASDPPYILFDEEQESKAPAR